jgi:EAL domain-containing protein (putative c-di-GMP-specific phosphodiesterase class I)
MPPCDISIHAVIAQRSLNAVFQPIVDMSKGVFYGYEGLIRGPDHTSLSSPDLLFAAALARNKYDELNFLAASIVVEKFIALRLPGKLFLNMSPAALTSANDLASERFFRGIGLSARRIVIELTEQTQAVDPALLKRNIAFYRRLGFQIALDDLGQGYSSLGLWMDIQPEFVKADKQFVSGADKSQRQRYFLEGIQGLARASGAQVIAEGIETHEEFILMKTLAIGFGQGYYISKPSKYPTANASDSIGSHFKDSHVIRSISAVQSAA